MTVYTPSMADDVATYLEENSLGTVGTDIFVNNAPEQKSDFFLITDTGGSKPEQNYPIDHPSVQIARYGRAADHNKTYQKILDAYYLLNRKQNIDIGQSDAMFVQAVAKPQCIGLDPDKKRWLFTFNAIFKIRGSDSE